ncbi:gag-pol fusion protein [Penaeus vannamei]|uniref:Gag-pol fusion protein n=1 Tax=Penaeus vannamei TaxID=6689 RepID=A0A423TXR2_PENVA|nr:gag-pol fusion protein [Penaeus vannamei]
MPSDVATPAPPTPADSTPRLQPLSTIVRFDDRITVDAMLRETEEYVAATYPALSDRSSSEFSDRCLQHVLQRLDQTSVPVRQVLTAFEMSKNRTWDDFKTDFRLTFAPKDVPPFLQTARMFNLRPASFSPIDLHLLGANIRSSFDRMTCALRGSPNLSALPHGQQETQTTYQPRRTTGTSLGYLRMVSVGVVFVQNSRRPHRGDAPLLPAVFEGRPAYFFVDSGSAVSLVPLSTLVNFNVLSPVCPSNCRPDAGRLSKDDRTRRSPFAISTPAQDLQDRCHTTTTTPNVKTSTTRWFPVRVTSTDGTALITPDGIRVKGLCALPAIYEVTNGTSALRLINATCTPVRLRRGTRVCDCEVTGLPVVEVEPPIAPVCNTSATTSAPDAPGPEETLCEFPPMDFAEGDVLRRLLKEFPSLLPTKDRPLGRTDVLRHRIDLIPGTKPIYIPSYRIPHSRRAAFKEATDALLAQGIIEPSQSPWSAPMLLVPKKDGSLRPVIDYRRLNAATVPDRYPIPTIRTLLQEVGEGHAIFSSIDLAHGFLQVEMDPSSKDLTAFSTPHGHFAFTRMPFGLRNSPITFSRLMSLIMQGLIGDTAFLYLDDLLIASKNIADHERKLKLVFQRLADANLTINVKKCQFFRKQTEYLGHTVDSSGLRPNDKKVRDVQNFPVPSTVTQVKAFLGLSGFYRPFIEKFGIIAEPLTRLLKKDAPCLINWARCRPYATSRWTLQTHRLRQSKTETAESNYSVTDLEALAVVWALKHFREIILGYNVHVLTDHRPLKYILTDSKHVKGRQARWLDTLLEFNPKIDYMPGSANKVADALSRNVSVNHLSVLSPLELQAKQRADPLYADIIAHLEDTTKPRPTNRYRPIEEFYLRDGLLFRKSAPKKLRGSKQRRTYHQLVIPEVLVRTCQKLPDLPPLQGTHCRPNARTHLRHTRTTLRQSEYGHSFRVYIHRNRNRYLLVMIDSFSRYTELAPIPDKSAQTVAPSSLTSSVAMELLNNSCVTTAPSSQIRYSKAYAAINSTFHSSSVTSPTTSCTVTTSVFLTNSCNNALLLSTRRLRQDRDRQEARSLSYRP